MRRSKKAAGAMSCLLGALLCGFVIMGRPAYAEGYQGQVLMSGQYERSTGANEHKYTKEEAKTFTSAADKLGGGAEHEGGLQHLKTNFLGWTDQPLTADGDIAEGAHFYLAEDTVGDAFPAGLYDGAKLYAVYAGIEVPDTSNPFGVFGWMGSYDSGKLNDMINRSNRLLINKDISDEDMLPYTTLSSEKSDAATGKVVDTYEPSDDVNRINEVVLDAEFTMNPRTSLLVYKDPTFNFGKIGVLTENYGKKFTSGGFSLATGKEAGYTYTDLKMQLPEGLTLPETLYLELDSYTYRPLYVTAGGENLTIINPATQESLGNDKNSFTSLVSSTSPKTIFGVRVAPGTTEIVIRAIVRSNGSTAADSIEKIQAASIAPTDGKSRAEIIASPMRLRVLRRADLKYILPNATPENLNASVIRVSDEKAKELALTEGTQTLPVTGSIEGVARASVGMFNLPFVGNTQLEKYYRINNVAAEMGRSIGYTMPKTYDKHNMTVTETLTGDLLVDDETEHAAVYETEKGAQLSVRGRLDVKKIKNQMAAIEAQYNGAAADSIRIENVDCSFTATLTLPEGMEYPEDVRPQLFGAADSFTITDVQKNGRTLTVKMALKEGITNYAQMKAAVDAVENSLYVTVPGITFADASTADTNYTITGSITGHLRADATVDAARQTVHFDFTWKTVQLPEGADAIDPDSQAITLTVRYRAQDGEDNGNTDNGGGTDNGDHDSGREDGGNEANSDRLPGDLLIGEETEHTAVYETEKGAQLSVRGRLDVEKVKKQMAAVEEAYGGNIPPEAILLSEVEGNFTAVLYLPEGMDFTENTTAELSGAGDGFAVTQTIRNGRQLTVNMKLKDGVETYAELKSIVESMENSLYVTVNSIVFTEASRPETNYTINGNFAGMMRAKATVAGSGQSVPFAYSWTAYQLPEGADFLALDSSDIRLTLKYNRSNVDEGNNNNGGGTDNGDHDGGREDGGNEANSDRLPGDLLIGEETEHTAVYETEKGAQLSVRGRLDVEKVKKQMAAVEEAYGGNIPPEAILLSEVEGNFTAVLYLPEGMDFTEITTAELSGAGDGFAVTQTIRNGRQLTVNMKLKDGVETYAELKSIVESMENSLYVTVNSIVFTEASRPETNYTINGNFAGMMRAKATVAGSGQSVPFAYSWAAYQLPEGADFLALDSSDIRLTLKYNRSNVDEGNNNNGGSNHNGGTDNGGSDHNGGTNNGGSDHNGGTNNGGSNNNGGTNNGGSDNNGGRDNNASGNNGHAAHGGDENAAVNHRGNSPADREPVKNNSVMAAPLTGDRQSATAMFAGLITVSLGVIGVVAIIIFRRKRERK